MNPNIESFIKLIKSMGNHDRSKNVLSDYSTMIKNGLDVIFENYGLRCKHVFITRGNGTDRYCASVIPIKPTNITLKTDFLREYDIDIDLSSLGSTIPNNIAGRNPDEYVLTPEEMVTFIFHEIIANLITNETLLRFKKLIVKYYDTSNSDILHTLDAYGMMLWIGIFSRTKKRFLSEHKFSEVNNLLEKFGLSEYWDSAFKKYINLRGISISELTKDYSYYERLDKIQLRKFNELARKYSSYSLKYNNTDYSTMIKYVISSTNSELVKYYLSKEPESVPTIPEKHIYLLFDDSKLLLESAENLDNVYDGIESIDILKTIDDLNTHINDIRTESEKLICSAKLKELSNLISYKLTKVYNPNSRDLLEKIKDDVNVMISKIINLDVVEEVSVLECE